MCLLCGDYPPVVVKSVRWKWLLTVMRVTKISILLVVAGAVVLAML